jgi:glycosyltransferase involved in cell wall biosynthesis
LADFPGMTALRIDVDVTPIRDDGSCGGAKPFVLDLLKGLATASRPHRYRLLTAAHNHESFAAFESLGMARQRVDDPDQPCSLRAAGTNLLFCPMTAPTYAEPGVKTLAVLYDLQHEAYPSFFSSHELAHRRRFYRDLTSRADHIVCISEFSRISLIRRLGVPPDRTSVIPIAIHRRLMPLTADEAWTRLNGRLPRCRFALYPANFWPHKNHRLLLVAFGRFLKEHPDSDLHLVLTGELLSEGEKFLTAVEHMGLSARVHVLGFVSEDHLAALWSTTTCLVFPSLFEGFGIPLTEAMAFGKPILTSREASLPEVAGDDAIYFDARNPQTLVDALALVTSRPDGLDARIESARRRLDRYQPPVVLEQYLDAIDRTAVEALRPPLTSTPELNGSGRLLDPFEAYARFLEDQFAPSVGAHVVSTEIQLSPWRERVAQLESQLQASETDRAARLELIHSQGSALGRIPALEADVAYLTGRVQQSEGVIETQGAEIARLAIELRRRSGWRRLWPWA